MRIRRFCDGHRNLREGLSREPPRLEAGRGAGSNVYIRFRPSFLDPRIVERIADPQSICLARIHQNPIVFEPTALKLLLEMGGAGRAMFGTDHPHPADTPLLLGVVEDLSAKDAAAVTGGNTMRLFGPSEVAPEQLVATFTEFYF